MTWPETASLTSIGSQQFKRYWQWFIHLQHKRTYKGYALTEEYTKEKPSILWSIALMATWRVGLTAHVHTLGKHRLQNIFQLAEAPPHPMGIPPIILLEQTDGLWNTQCKEEFAFIVSWCEKALWPLWISVRMSSPETKASPTNQLAQAFQKELPRKKKHLPLRWLSCDSKSRLSSLCLGANKLI